MKKILTCRSEGNFGRWGNKILAYCFAKGLARANGAELQWPENSPLRKVFQINDPFIEDNGAIQTSLDSIPTQKHIDTLGTIDLNGYWQFQDALDYYTRTDMLTWLQFQPWVLDILDQLPQYTLVVHKRRGDYTQKPEYYCNIKDSSFDRILETVKSILPIDGVTDTNTVHIISEENPMQDPVCDKLGLGFLPDWLLMVKARGVIRSNSTFSYTAPIFGKNNVLAPVVENKTGWQDVEWVRGNWPVMAPPAIHGQLGAKLTDLHLKD